MRAPHPSSTPEPLACVLLVVGNLLLCSLQFAGQATPKLLPVQLPVQLPVHLLPSAALKGEIRIQMGCRKAKAKGPSPQNESPCVLSGMCSPPGSADQRISGGWCSHGGAEARREQREETATGPGGQLARPVLLPVMLEPPRLPTGISIRVPVIHRVRVHKYNPRPGPNGIETPERQRHKSMDTSGPLSFFFF
jgi:hypothetical protein